MKSNMLCIFVLSISALAADKPPESIHTYFDIARVARAKLGIPERVLKWLPKGGLKNLRIAILDNGFDGVPCNGDDKREEKLREVRYLPKSTEFICQYGKSHPTRAPKLSEKHGLHIAQVIWGVLGFHSEGPKFILLNAHEKKNFKLAVKTAIERRVHMIVFSQNWEAFGNFDGKGPMNELVDLAINSGIIWFQAAGNYGRMVRNAFVRCGKENRKCRKGEYVNFFENHGSGASTQDSRSQTRLKLKNRVADNRTTFRLAWDADWSGGFDKYRGTNKDLDFVLFERRKGDKEPKLSKLVNLKQYAVPVGEEIKPKRDFSLFPRETLKKTLSVLEHPYEIAVKVNSNNFSTMDRLRITLIAGKEPHLDLIEQELVPTIEFVGKSSEGEIMIPADNKNVITVGTKGRYSSRGPTRDGRSKPDIIIPLADVHFSDNYGTEGTSFANAYAASMAAYFMAQSKTTLNRKKLLEKIKLSLRKARF